MTNAICGKTVIITGASSGIGRETALAFGRNGANVVLVARREAALRRVVDALPHPRGRLLPVTADVTIDNNVARIVDQTLSAFGRIDCLVNNAGAGLRGKVTDVPIDDVRRLLELNFFAAVRCIHAVIPAMRNQRAGQIVNVGSVLSVIPTPFNSAYCASKFALKALTDALRMELCGSGIEVISILPGYTDTPFFENMLRYEGPAKLSPFRGQSPVKVAEAILRACRKGKREVVLTRSGKLGVSLKQFAPQVMAWALSRPM